MNPELKKMLDVIFDVEGLTVEIIAKKYANLISDMIKLAGEVPSAVDHFSDLVPELKALQDSAHLNDLLAYLQGKLSGVLTSEKGKEYLVVALSMVKHLALLAQDAIQMAQVAKS